MAARRSSKGTPRRGFLSSHPFWPRSQQQPSPPDCPPIPILQLPDASPSGGFPSLSGVCKAPAWINCVVLTPLRRSVTRWLLYSLMASDASLLFQPNVLDSGIAPLLQLPHPWLQIGPALPHPPSSFLCSTEFFMDRYIPLGWSGTPASIHLLLGEKFCI